MPERRLSGTAPGRTSLGPGDSDDATTGDVWKAGAGGLLALLALAGMLVSGGFDLEESPPWAEPRADWVPAFRSMPTSDKALAREARREANSDVARLRLQGVVSSGLHGDDMALVSSDHEAARAVGVGESVLPGLVLQSIEPDRVVLGPPGGGISFVLDLWRGEEAATTPSWAGAGKGHGEGSRALADASREISHREEGDPSGVPTEASTAPVGDVALGDRATVRTEEKVVAGRAARGRRNRLNGVAVSH